MVDTVERLNRPCVECRFYHYSLLRIEAECMHTQALKKTREYSNPVTGEREKPIEYREDCLSMRHFGSCGTAGWLFEPVEGSEFWPFLFIGIATLLIIVGMILL